MNNFREKFKLQCDSFKYSVDESKGIVVAIGKFRILTYVLREDILETIGIAKVNTNAGDIFDAKIGKKIARAKAEKEAYHQFKILAMEYKRRAEKQILKVQNTIDKMNACIQHQKEYIKSF